VLSGFILTYVYPELSPRQIPRFWWARFARIWPAHVAALIFAVLLLPASFVNRTGEIWPLLAHLTLVHAWIPGPTSYFAFNQVAWSISDEFAFYLSFPLLLMLLARSRLLVLLASATVLGGAIVLCNLLLEGPQTPPSALVPIYFMYQNPLGRQLEFVLGMCACYIWRRVHTNKLLTPLNLHDRRDRRVRPVFLVGV
jgi:peptidoglycan/LPS O-acetylase OafA/YrhL